VEPVGAPRVVVQPTATAPAIIQTPTRVSGVPAVSVGVTDGGSTTLSMVPADMWNGPRTDVTEFRIISITAGHWS